LKAVAVFPQKENVQIIDHPNVRGIKNVVEVSA